MDIKILKEAALKFGTPIYLYDLKIIENQFDKLNKELSVLENYKIHFAAKSLSNISILKFIKKMGAGLDAVSIEEVMIGLKCGFNKDEILYTPNGVSFEEIKQAFKLGVKINLDSIESVKDFVNDFGNQSITVRINPGIYAGGNDNVSVGHSKSKFGIPEERIDELLDMEKKDKIKITGLHIHTGSDITKNNQFKEGIKKIFSIARDFKNIESIDLGGGIKIPYFKDDTSTNLNDYVKEVLKELKKFELEFKKKLKLIFEPGKFLVSDCGFFITKVNYIKSTKTKDFLQVDSGLNHLLRPTLYGSHHEIINLSNPAGKKKEYDVVGYICEKDTFAEKRKIPKTSVGDLICFKNAGAYGFEMSSNYNSRLKPAEVCIYNNKILKIREAQSLNDLLIGQIDIF
ncbi:MAG: diaminopimelate decarboxylase [Candidatus Marisimplicoccus sp.]